tara:strand:+ start:959 stop:1459 length:501 start_codon:yes stop_codon:yes gene_type:complete
LGREIKKFIKEVPDFPTKGIFFKDIQPLLQNARAFEDAINGMVDLLQIDLSKIDYVVGIESRGFIFGTAMAWITNSGFKMIRKPGKLPNKENLVSFKYDLEYGSDTIEIERGEGNVIIVDDVFATGGTMQAAKEICVEAGYQVLDLLCLIDIGLIKNHSVKCLISY